jgi:hypothetical protein
MQLTIELNPTVEAILSQQAQQRNTTPEELVVEAINEKFASKKLPEPKDDWERLLLSIAVDCGTSLSNEDLSSEGLYD